MEKGKNQAADGRRDSSPSTGRCPKDGGRAGGVLEKLQAARSEHCRVVALRRPHPAEPDAFTSLDGLLRAVQKAVPDYRRGPD